MLQKRTVYFYLNLLLLLFLLLFMFMSCNLAKLLNTETATSESDDDDDDNNNYPAKDITNVVVWGAGGGTDTTNRVLMAEMQKELGVNINVINKSGGVAGAVGMTYAYDQSADGYTFCGLSESCVTSSVQDGFKHRMNVWDYFIIGGSPEVISVNPDSSYTTLTELIDDARGDKKEEIKISASGTCSIHHLNVLALEKGTDAKFDFVPHRGSRPAQEAAVNGDVTAVITSIVEQAQLIRGGKLRVLAVLQPNAFDFEGSEIPSAFTAYPELDDYLPMKQTIAFAVKKDVNQTIKTALKNAFDTAMKSTAMNDFAKKNFYVLSGKSGDEAGEIFNNLESVSAWSLQDLGAARINPETLNIPRP